jgi:hypothetical protein
MSVNGLFSILEAVAKFKQFEINMGLASEAILRKSQPRNN